MLLNSTKMTPNQPLSPRSNIQKQTSAEDSWLGWTTRPPQPPEFRGFSKMGPIGFDKRYHLCVSACIKHVLAICELCRS